VLLVVACCLLLLAVAAAAAGVAASLGVYYQGLASTGTSQEYGSFSVVLGAKSWAS
jgi:hypothetical protein